MGKKNPASTSSAFHSLLSSAGEELRVCPSRRLLGTAFSLASELTLGRSEPGPAELSFLCSAALSDSPGGSEAVLFLGHGLQDATLPERRVGEWQTSVAVRRPASPAAESGVGFFREAF